MSLRVMTIFGSPLVMCFTGTIIPLMLLNFWLIGWMPAAGDLTESTARYLVDMALLVFIQAPLASLLVTPFLGSALFMEEFSLKSLWQCLRQSAWSLIGIQLLLRGIALSWLLAFLIPRDGTYSGWEVWLVLLALYVVVLRRSALCERNYFAGAQPLALARSESDHCGPA